MSPHHTENTQNVYENIFLNRSESPGLTGLRELAGIAGKQVHDANIVATMKAYSITTLLTHNVKDFKRFAEIIKIEEI